MAVRSKRNGYEVYWRDPATGRQRGRLFKTRAEAEKEDRRVKLLLRTDRKALLLEDAVDAAADADVHRFSSAVVRLLAVRGGSLTVQETSMLKMLDGRYGGADLRGVTVETYIDLYEWLSGRGWKPQSVARVYAVLGMLLRFALDLGLIETLPRRFRLPPGRPEEFVPPTPDELSRLYEVASPRLKRVIVLGAGFGMRVGPCELLSLMWSDVDFSGWVIRLRSARKNRRVLVRTLPIPDAYRQLFSDWHAEDGNGVGYVVHFFGRKVVDVGYLWKKALKAAGIARKIRLYDLRHAFATNMLEKGVDIGTVAKLMGHSSTMMVTRHYQYVREERKMDALSALDPIVCPRRMDSGGGRS